RSGAGRPVRPAPTTRERTSGACRGASGRTGASMGRAPARRRDEVGPPSPRSVLAPPSPTPSVGFAPGTCSGAWEDLEGMLLTDRPAAALPPSYPLTETACGRDLAVLISRRGGTDEFLGRGGVSRSRAPGNGGPADPWKSVWCSRVLTPLVEPVRRSRVRVESRAVPVVTPWGEKKSRPVHRPYLDRRGHKRVRPSLPSVRLPAPFLLRKSSRVVATASGDSISSPCPAFSCTTNSAPRMPRASCPANGAGSRMSSPPTRTRVGQSISTRRSEVLHVLIARL